MDHSATLWHLFVCCWIPSGICLLSVFAKGREISQSELGPTNFPQAKGKVDKFQGL